MIGTRLVLVRHGESQAQAGDFLGGHETCTGLSDLGRRQVTALRDRLAVTGELADAAHLYASVLPRAIETAEIISPALGDLAVEQDCDLCELHLGEGDGLSWDEYDRRFPLPDSGWDPTVRRDAGGETWAEMAERISLALDRLVERHVGETVVIACHGGVIVHVMLEKFAMSLTTTAGRAFFHPDNASITEFGYEEMPFGGQVRAWNMIRFNDHAHLSTLR